jgi:hypothetical protein
MGTLGIGANRRRPRIEIWRRCGDEIEAILLNTKNLIVSKIPLQHGNAIFTTVDQDIASRQGHMLGLSFDTNEGGSRESPSQHEQYGPQAASKIENAPRMSRMARGKSRHEHIVDGISMPTIALYQSVIACERNALFIGTDP